ncbi:hypothetical protein [Thioflexithrix psekupsensis]|uniref:Glycerophosphoryl diester phosphodiesterase membrane domain-containing protein n=1 Tax=Thioflexithrix psekupsensis TaxID=1570016 RepID=A0A251X9E8_9GAMM|nr:hypothetical protein [Thioflexithrix psekupsensis]OUD14424.1 hypothetical protein TPSD3_08935 [Thioflexithrix psekupsensis]
MFELPKTPQNMLVLFGLGIRLFQASFKVVLPTILMVALLSILPSLFIENLFSSDQQLQAEAIASLMSMFPLQLALLLWLYAALFVQIVAFIRGHHLATREALSYVMPKLLVLYLACWIYAIGVALGLMVIILGVLLMVSMVFFMPFVLFENARIFNSLWHSHQLVWGYWWHSAGVLFVPMLAMFVGGLSLAGMGESLAYSLNASPEFALQMAQIIYNVISSFLTPFMVSIMVVLFHDLKLRRTGRSSLLSSHDDEGQHYFLA